MKPTECAFYLIGKFYINSVIRSKDEAIKCSILAIDEILKDTTKPEYWNEVKKILSEI